MPLWPTRSRAPRSGSLTNHSHSDRQPRSDLPSRRVVVQAARCPSDCISTGQHRSLPFHLRVRSARALTGGFSRAAGTLDRRGNPPLDRTPLVTRSDRRFDQSEPRGPQLGDRAESPLRSSAAFQIRRRSGACDRALAERREPRRSRRARIRAGCSPYIQERSSTADAWTTMVGPSAASRTRRSVQCVSGGDRRGRV